MKPCASFCRVNWNKACFTNSQRPYFLVGIDFWSIFLWARSSCASTKAAVRRSTARKTDTVSLNHGPWLWHLRILHSETDMDGILAGAGTNTEKPCAIHFKIEYTALVLIWSARTTYGTCMIASTSQRQPGFTTRNPLPGLSAQQEERPTLFQFLYAMFC